MFINFYDYIIQILEWCQLNCLKNTIKNTIKKDTKKIKETINKDLSKNDLFDDWVDYGFGENDVIH